MNGHPCPRCGAVTLRLGVCSQCARACEALLADRVVTKCSWLSDWDHDRWERYQPIVGAGGTAVPREGDVWTS